MPAKIRSSRIAGYLAILLLLVVLGTVAIAISVARTEVTRQWEVQLDNLSLLLAAQTSQEVTSAFLVLDSIVDSVHTSEVGSANELRSKMGTLAHFNSMRDKIRGLPQADVATIVAANGDVINFTRSHPAPVINLADRDYFQEQLKQPRLGVYFSKPVRNKGNGQWTFYLSRRLNGPNGEFIGLALVGFSSTFLSQFYQKINLGSGASVSLYRRDFTLLARWPHVEQLMGQVNLTGSSYQVVERMKQRQGVVQTASPRASQGGAEIARMGAVRLIDSYPLIINVTVTDELYLAQWRHFSTVRMLVAAAIVLAMAIVFMVLIRSLKRRERHMEETRVLKSAAEAANLAKSEFLALMSHEIRTPLTAIIGFAELMDKPQSGGASSNAAALIVRNGKHLLRIINDILDISKIEAGHMHLDRLAFSPLELIQGMQAMMDAQAASKGIGFDVAVEYPFPAQVMGDPTRWNQILFNLCSNAVKFTEQGGVRVKLWHDTGRSKLVCNIADTGIGISEDQLVLLFQPFSQADSTIARKYGGTGLGLHLVRQMAGKMGGQVNVISELGRGSVFEVEVDAIPAIGSDWLDEAPQSIVAAAEPDPFGKRMHGHVLLAEDGADNSMLIGAFLNGVGLSFELARDGAQAVELALAGTFSLILMDMQMPVMDGLQATSVLRAAGFSAPIVAVTANVMPEDVQRYLRGGCSGCVGKPIDFSELGNLLARLLDQAGMASDTPAAIEHFAGYAELCAAFTADLAARLAKLAEHIDAAAWREAAALAHQLKGSAGSFGYPGVTRTADDIEQAAVRADGPAVRAAFARLLALDELMLIPVSDGRHVEP
jgi:signal transduction histidine kinase/DNA-binding response OmpR family regulator